MHIYFFFLKIHSQITNNNCCMDNSKSKFGLLLEKRSLDDDIKIGELPIFDMDTFNMTIQNFFENDDYYKNSSSIHRIYFFRFTFGFKKYMVHLSGIENKREGKKIIVKFFDFLKNIMVQDFCYSPYSLFDDDEDDDIIHLIGDIIKNSRKIKKISLPGYYLKDDIFKILYKYMMNHEGLKHLDFKFLDLNLSYISFKYVDDIIKTSNIEDISGLNDDEYSYFFEKLLNNFFRGKNLNLNLNEKNMSDDLVLKLSDMIKKKEVDYLKEINLSSNRITSKGFSMLVNSLLESKNNNIIKINMHDNKLDDNCIESLGELIKKNEHIQHISFEFNKITDKGIEKLSEYIVGNIFIKSIALYGNWKITDASCETIKHMIKMSSILSIDLSGMNVNKQNLQEIEELLKIPIEERKIPLITFQDVKPASKRMKE